MSMSSGIVLTHRGRSNTGRRFLWRRSYVRKLSQPWETGVAARRSGPKQTRGREVTLKLSVPPLRESVQTALRSAADTVKNPTELALPAGALKKRFLAFRKACWAKPMRWFGATFIRLQHISHGPIPDCLK